MSWETYMDTLNGYVGNKMTYGAICGKDGNQWASKGDIPLNPGEVCSLVKICEDCDKDKAEAQTKGVFLGGKKFTYLRNDKDEKSVDFSKNVDGKLHTGYVQLTNQAVVVCVTEEDSKNANAHNGACKLAGYLKDTGY